MATATIGLHANGNGIPLGHVTARLEPPHNLEAEMRALGSILHDPDMLPAIAAIVEPADFFRPDYEILYRVILDLHGQGQPILGPVVTEAMLKLGRTRKGSDELNNECLEGTPDPVNGATYASIVRQKSLLRQAAQVVERYAPRLGNTKSDPSKAIGDLIANLTEVLAKADPATAAEEAEPDDYMSATLEELGGKDASEIEEENPVWLWEGRFMRGKINLVGGDGGDGKTTIAIMVGATVINGGNFPDGTPAGPPGRVAILSAEDGAADTLKPRFIAAGANLEPGRLTFLDASCSIPKKGNRPALVHPTSLQDMSYWRAVFTKLQLDIIIIDPLPAYLGRGVNDHKNSEVQTALNRFAALANEFRVCVIAITHTGKAKDVKMVHKILGSVAYTNCARVVHVTAHDPDDQTIRYLARVKCNLDEPRDPLAYKLEGFEYQRGEKTFKTSRVVFEAEPVKIDLDAIATGKGGGRGPAPEKTMAMAEWLYDFLAAEGAPTPLAAIMDAAGQAGLIGTKKTDGKWSNPKILYDAAERVPALGDDRPKKRVTDFKLKLKAGGRDIVHWELAAPATEVYDAMMAANDMPDFDEDKPF